jgi:hypothetical protein
MALLVFREIRLQHHVPASANRSLTASREMFEYRSLGFSRPDHSDQLESSSADQRTPPTRDPILNMDLTLCTYYVSSAVSDIYVALSSPVHNMNSSGY